MQFWSELEGQVIDRQYPLRRLLRSEGRTAWFETAADGARAAIISLTESLTDADEVTERLMASQRLANPYLLGINKIGRAQIEKTLFVYAVMEYSDQNLSGVLRDRVLTKEEARQVAEALTGALSAIHQTGIAHGRVEPANVLAVGEAVKLRSDCLQSPGGSRAGDIAGIGATLFEALTQRRPSSADDPEINRIPAPFAEIVRNSLSGRWGVAQIAGALRPSTPSAQPPRPPAATPTVPPPAATAALGPAKVAPQKTQPADVPEEEGHDARSRFALYVVLGVVLAAFLGWLIVRPRSSQPDRVAVPPVVLKQAPSQTATAPPPVAAPAEAPAARRDTARAARSTQKPAAIEPEAQTSPGNATERTIWRVVAYTYHHQDQAQHKADELNRAHPELSAEVFSPYADGRSYLVTVGGAMERSQAFAMRNKALSMGLPEDIYPQNFSH